MQQIDFSFKPTEKWYLNGWVPPLIERRIFITLSWPEGSLDNIQSGRVAVSGAAGRSSSSEVGLTRVRRDLAGLRAVRGDRHVILQSSQPLNPLVSSSVLPPMPPVPAPSSESARRGRFWRSSSRVTNHGKGTPANRACCPRLSRFCCMRMHLPRIIVVRCALIPFSSRADTEDAVLR